MSSIDHIGRLKELHVWMNQASIDVVWVALGVADADVINFSKLADCIS